MARPCWALSSSAGWSEVMEESYPRLLMDRKVAVIRDGQPEQTRLRGWLDGYDGPVPTYRIELVARVGNYTCPYTATGPDMFEALVRLRRAPWTATIRPSGSRGAARCVPQRHDAGYGRRNAGLRHAPRTAYSRGRPGEDSG